MPSIKHFHILFVVASILLFVFLAYWSFTNGKMYYFYGSLFSSLIFNPFAEKLQLRNRENRQASELMIAGLLLIWQKKHPLDVSDMLTSYIEPKDRLKYFSDQD